MNFLNKASEFLDNHFRFIQNTGYVVTSIGILVIAKRARLFTKFKSVESIPNEFITKRIQLRGTVKLIKPDNVIHAEHIPAFRYPFSFLVEKYREKPKDELLLNMAGISLTTEGSKLLMKELAQKTIWFEILCFPEYDNGNPIIPAIIYRRTRLLMRNMNVQVVKNGWAVASRIPDCVDASVEKSLTRLVMTAQKKAATKKRGVWKE